jgi:DNA-binding MarR family transcriptional regulator
VEPESSVSYLLLHAAAIMGRQADQILQERLGIGMSQFRILTTLQQEPGVRQRQLADRLGQTEASISRQVKLMSEKGLLAATVSSKSRREHVTLPTPKGLKVTEAAKDALAAHHQLMIDTLTKKQQSQLAETLNILHGYICAAGKPYACDHPDKI